MNIRELLLLFALIAWGGLAFGQEEIPEGFQMVTYEGETYMTGGIAAVNITAKKPSKAVLRRGKRRLAKFTRLRWNVHKVYPYAHKVSAILEEVKQDLVGISDEKARKNYIRDRETSLFGAYEKDIRHMSRSQGKVLVKLVYRQTGASTFDLIKETKGGVAAIFWQSIGIIFGINLKKSYDPEEDAMIETIVQELEGGGYNIAHKRYNFTLD